MFEALQLARVDGDDIAVIAVAGGMLIAVISIVSGVVHRTVVTRQREQSRREIAAYVAEGSITADDAAKLLAEGKGPGCGWKRA